jgi:hypothetical protein
VTGTQRNSFLCVVALFIGASLGLAQQPGVSRDAITVHTVLNRTLFAVGEPIQLSVMISNVSTQPLLIPNRLSFFGDSQGQLTVELTSDEGSPVSGISMAFDCKDYKATKLTYQFVLTDYILLRPATSYMQQISLLVLFPELEPGSYHLKSSYSAGLFPLGCQRFNHEEIDKFPLKAWKGSTAANEVSFKILPKATKR